MTSALSFVARYVAPSLVRPFSSPATRNRCFPKRDIKFLKMQESYRVKDKRALGCELIYLVPPFRASVQVLLYRLYYPIGIVGTVFFELYLLRREKEAEKEKEAEHEGEAVKEKEAENENYENLSQNSIGDGEVDLEIDEEGLPWRRVSAFQTVNPGRVFVAIAILYLGFFTIRINMSRRPLRMYHHRSTNQIYVVYLRRIISFRPTAINQGDRWSRVRQPNGIDYFYVQAKSKYFRDEEMAKMFIPVKAKPIKN